MASGVWVFLDDQSARFYENYLYFPYVGSEARSGHGCAGMTDLTPKNYATPSSHSTKACGNSCSSVHGHGDQWM